MKYCYILCRNIQYSNAYSSEHRYRLHLFNKLTKPNYYQDDPAARLYVGPEAEAHYPDHLPDGREGADHQGGADQAPLQGGRGHGDEGVRSRHGVLQTDRC